jgi:hypothetical protein
VQEHGRDVLVHPGVAGDPGFDGADLLVEEVIRQGGEIELPERVINRWAVSLVVAPAKLAGEPWAPRGKKP